MRYLKTGKVNRGAQSGAVQLNIADPNHPISLHDVTKGRLGEAAPQR